MLGENVEKDIQNILGTQFLDSKVVDNKFGDDPVFQKLCAVEKVTQRAISRFPLQKVYVLLKKVMNARIIVGLHAGEDEDCPVEDIKLKSADQLKDMLSCIERENKEEIPEQDINSMKNGLGFFLNTLSYLTDLKEYFDANIHTCLKETYFDRSKHKVINKTELLQSINTENEKKTKKTAPSVRGNAARLVSKNSPRKNKQLKGTGVKNGTSGKMTSSGVADTESSEHSNLASDQGETPGGHRLAWFADELDEICNKWSRLLQSGELSIDDFDPDSHHELIQFVNYTAFEPLLRLVPDIFVKCYKAVEIGKVWLRQAYKVYNMALPTQNSADLTIEQQLKYFKEKIKQTSSMSSGSDQSNKKEKAQSSRQGSAEKNITTGDTNNESEHSRSDSGNNDVKGSHCSDEGFAVGKIKRSSSPVDFLDEFCDSNSVHGEDYDLLKGEFKRVYEQVKSLLKKLSDAMEDDEQQLKAFSDDMKTLLHNDVKFEQLKENYEQAIRDRETAINHYKNVVKRANDANEALSQLSKGSTKYYEQTENVKKLTEEELSARNKEELLGFKLNLLEEDYMLELEIRPDHIRRTGAMQQKISDLSNAVCGKRSEMNRVMKGLKALKAHEGKEKMMTQFLESAQNMIARLKLELRIHLRVIPVPDAADTYFSDHSTSTLTSRSVRFSDKTDTFIDRSFSRLTRTPSLERTPYSFRSSRTEA